MVEQNAQRRYLVTCEGTYYRSKDHKKDRTTYGEYTLEAVLPEEARTLGFLSVFRREILTEKPSRKFAIREKYPDWRRFRTHTITNVVEIDHNGKPKGQVRELQLMNRAQVVAYINKKGWPVDPDLYPEISELRQALRDFRANRDQFLKQQEKRRQSKGSVLSVAKSLEQLNPWLSNGTFGDIPDEDNASEKPLDETPYVEPEPDDYNNDTDPGIPEYDEADEFDQVLGDLAPLGV